ncbi:MAG: VWA domain-containing protein [Salinivenus sp.]
MDWLHPTYVWAWVAVPAVAYAFWRAVQWRRAARAQFGDAALVRRLAPEVPTWRRRLKAAIVVCAVAGLALSLMGPRLGTQLRTVERRGVDVVVALDVSASMRAQDVAPSRLRRAKNEIRDLLGGLRGDRVGLVLFAGDGIVQCPLTTDYGALRLFLDVAEPDQVPTPGTNFGAALDAATEAFSATRPSADSTARPDDRRAQVLLVLSDGENHVGDLEQIKQSARTQDITLFAAGVGTEEGGRIPVYKDGRRAGVKRNAQGRVVRTRLDEPALTSLAEGGAYFRVGATSSALSDLPTALRQLETSVLAEERFADYAEMYQWPLALALLLLGIEVLIPLRSRDRSGPPLAGGPPE